MNILFRMLLEYIYIKQNSIHILNISLLVPMIAVIFSYSTTSRSIQRLLEGQGTVSQNLYFHPSDISKSFQISSSYLKSKIKKSNLNITSKTIKLDKTFSQFFASLEALSRSYRFKIDLQLPVISGSNLADQWILPRISRKLNKIHESQQYRLFQELSRSAGIRETERESHANDYSIDKSCSVFRKNLSNSVDEALQEDKGQDQRCDDFIGLSLLS